MKHKRIEIIPAIDLIDGHCVRLTQGDYTQKSVYSSDPVEVAKSYEDIGIRRLHLVDLDGAKADGPQNLGILESIATRTGLEIQYGGGIKSPEALQRVFDAGAVRAIIGSLAVREPDTFAAWLETHTPARLILGADTRAGRVAINGWLEESDDKVETLLTRFAATGLSQSICTDISRDGMLSGPNFALYESLQSQFPQIDITVSGGVANIFDVEKAQELGLRSIIIGKAIYEGGITLKELGQWLQNA